MVPTSPSSFASSLAAQCCRLMDRKCTFSRRNKIPEAWGGESFGKGLWGLRPFLASPWTDPTKISVLRAQSNSPGNKRKLSCLVFCREAQRLPRQVPFLGQGTHVGHKGTNNSLRGELLQLVHLQNREPPELACQQPIQGSSAAQRPEAVARSLAWSRRQ